MHIVEQHVSPDGLLTLIVGRGEDGDLLVGFDGFEWHTHGELLAGRLGMSEEAAWQWYVREILDGRVAIAVSRVGPDVRDAWVVDDSDATGHGRGADEYVELRRWDGGCWSTAGAVAQSSGCPD